MPFIIACGRHALPHCGEEWKYTGQAGGWQNNRPSPPHEKYKFVENVFEELDAPGEWYLDRKEHILYLYPEQGTDLAAARLEAGGLEELVKIQGKAHPPSGT